MKMRIIKLLALLLALTFALTGCSFLEDLMASLFPEQEEGKPPSYEEAPASVYEERNGNVPYFTEDEITTVSYERYSELDSLGRCGVATACIGLDLMPAEDEERGSINSVYPSGWVQASYDSALVKGGYLYNRAHLIGWQLTAENANEKNLITGTRHLNNEGMLPFENMVAAYIKDTGNHVMYRITPEFKGDNLVASGVLMEAWSVEDDGEGICFCIYVFNYQPGITINYATGESGLDGEYVPPAEDGGAGDDAGNNDGDDAGGSSDSASYILNTSSKKFHDPDCSGAADISEANRQEYTGSREDLVAEGYSPCGICDPQGD